jgi:hypothetical protein
MFYMKQAFLFFALLFFHTSLFAFSSKESDSRFTYDISGSQSRVDGRSFQEINLGLNWYLQDWLVWRNAAFQRQGDTIDTVYGLDSSLRLQEEWLTDNRVFGVRAFAGPGVRLASSDSNAEFAEAGIGFKLGGVTLGVGAKALHYFQTRKDNNDVTLPKDENQIFLTIAGGGFF